MTFKAKLRKIGNSLGVIIPYKVITYYKEGDEIELDVITKGEITPNKDPNVITKPLIEEKPVITKSFNTKWCSKHGSMKGTCGCK